MSTTVTVCVALAAAAVGVWWVAFGLAARTDRLGELVLARLVGHLDRFEDDLACSGASASPPGTRGTPS